MHCGLVRGITGERFGKAALEASAVVHTASSPTLGASQHGVHMASSSTTALTVKQKVGLEMLSEALEGEFDAAFGVLVKVLGNLVAHPDDAKYRKLRTSNAKVQAMLATKGVRALLVGSGFAEEPDALNAETADVAAVQAALEALQALHASRAAQEAAQKAASMAERNLQVRATSTRPAPPLRTHAPAPPLPRPRSCAPHPDTSTSLTASTAR